MYIQVLYKHYIHVIIDNRPYIQLYFNNYKYRPNSNKYNKHILVLQMCTVFSQGGG